MLSNLTEKKDFDARNSITWDIRLHQALDAYSKIKGVEPALIPALKEGLNQWTLILPQSFQDDTGCYQPVNTWGLGPESTEIYAVVDWLILQQKENLSDSLRKKYEALYRTAQALDENFPALTPQEQAAEKRLVKMCQRQTDQLISFLERLVPVIFRFTQKKPARVSSPAIDTSPSPHRKRFRRATDIELLEKALTEHIQSARDYAWAAIDAGKGPRLLSPPLKKDIAKHTGLKPWALSRCLNDPHAHKLRLLWETAGNIEQILKFKKK